MTIKLVLAAFSLCIAGCSTQEQQATQSNDRDLSMIYQKAVANLARFDSDRERDTGRKPAEVLEFFDVQRGMVVLDLFSGGGYYSEILAGVVGETGRIVAHSNQAYLGFVGDEFRKRHADGRLPNVEVLMAENNELDLEPGEFDVILLVLSYHDIYHVDPDHGWQPIDGPKLLAEFHEGLKSDGVLAIVDHVAEPGAPRESGETVHRIDPAAVIEDLQAAGFTLAASSEMLRNNSDDYSKIVFDPEVRGKTDRFVLRFNKSE